MLRTLLLVLATDLFLPAPTTLQAQEATPVCRDRFGDPLPPGVLVRLGTVRFNRCSCAAYSPDGKFIVTGGGGTNVWEAATGKLIRRLPFESWGPEALIFSHDGKKLAAVGGFGASIDVWDLKTFQKIHLQQADGGGGGGDWSSAAAFSADDTKLVAATSRKLFVWDLATGRKLKEFPLPVKQPLDVRMVAFSEDGKVAATQSDGVWHLWNAQTGQLLHEIKLSSHGGGETMKFSRDGKMLVVSGYGHWLRIFSVETGKKVHSLQVSERVRSVAFSPDGKTLAAASNDTIGSSSTDGDQVIQLWDFTNLKSPPVKYAAPGVHSVIFSPDGKTLAWNCCGQTLCFMDRATGKDLRPTPTHRGAIKALVYLPDGKRIISASEDGTIRIWDAATGESLRVLRGHVCEINGLALFPNGKRLVSCGRDHSLRLWDIENDQQLAVLKDEGNEVRTVAFSPDGKRLASGGWRSVLFLRHPATGKVLDEFEAHPISGLALLATGSKEAVLLWEAGTGKVKRRLALAGKEIKAIAFSRDGKLLAGGGGKTIRFWDPVTGTVHGDCSNFPNSVETVAFSGDGKTLFSGHDQEHALRRWHVAGRKPLGEFRSPIAPVRMLSFSRDSRTILASSMGEDFYLWEAETGKPCPMPKKDDERFLADWLASSGQSALLRCEEGVGSQLAMILTGKIDRLDQVPGFIGSSVDGRRVLVQSEKDKRPCFSVLKTSRNALKDEVKRKGAVEREFIWKEGDEVSAALSPDGKTVVAAGKDVVCFFDVNTGKERRDEHPTNPNPKFIFSIQSVKFSADGSRIALVGREGKVRILAVKDGRRIAEFTVKSRSVTGLAFSPDGQTLLTTSLSAPVYAWEIATGQMVRRLKAGTYLYSPDNRLLARSAESLEVFDLYSGRVLRECKAEGTAFGNFAFSPNSKFLAASCSDTTILVWPSVSAGVGAGKLWDEKSLVQALEKGSAAEAYAAMGRMLADPRKALELLERRLRPAPNLDKNQAAMSAEDVLHLRAIQVLERIGTKRARQLLEHLAGGAAISPRTRAAVEALRRLEAH